VIGFNNVDKAITNAFALTSGNHFNIIWIITSAIVLATGFQLIRLRRI